MRSRVLRFAVWLAVLVLLTATPLAIAAPPAPSAAGLAPFDPYILTIIEAEGQADFFVVLKIQADLSAASALATKEAKGQYVFDALTEVAAKTQGPVLDALAGEGATFEPFWIRNMVRVRGGDKALLMRMAARPDVAEIFYEYEPILDVDPESAGRGPDAIEWNILRVNADDVWGMGITGAGAVVADLDSGVQWDHPALVNSYRPQIPGAPTRHDYNWYDGSGGSAEPLDYASHGTHTMGTIVGDDGGANQIGVAPGADWIACPGIGSPNVGAMDCFQFFLAPTKLDGSDPRPDLAPHVINNSWSSSGTDYHPIIQTLYAAGIFYAKSAGNEGSGCGTITTPGQWPEVTATAAFAQGDTIAGFSSRGPVTIGHDVLVKPDIAAPGVNVRSSLPGNNYGPNQGTSMACPHVTGAVALLISANPELAGQIDVLQMILKQTAEPMIDAQCPPYVDHPNNVWGWGILDTLAAVNLAQVTDLGGIEGQVYDGSTMAPVADAEITFEDTATGWLLYETSAATGDYSHTLPVATYDITATHYGYLPGVVPGVVIQDGVTTTQDIPLDVAPIWEVSGTVAETGTGDPLAAHIVFEETPITADTDPATGLYSADVAQGTWWMQASSAGHAGEDRLVTVDQDLTEDFTLAPVENYYMKAGDGPCDPAFDWIDASGGTSYCLSDDSSQYVTLPAPFTFYGTTYTYFFIGSNGHVTFGAGNNKWSGPIPDPALPNNGIYAFSTDLNPNSCSQGTIYTDYLDDRYLVIEWNQVEHYPSGNPETFEIILDMVSGKVTIQFLTVSDPSQVVVGVENADGTEATQYAYDDPVLIANDVAVDFYPAFGTPPPTGDLGDIEGTVTDLGSGDPIEGAMVNAVAFSGGEEFSYTTDASGFYSGTLCADWYSMTATAEGYRSSAEVQAEVYSGTLTVQDFQLELGEADLYVDATWPATATAGALVTYTLVYGSLGPDTAPYTEVGIGLSPWVEYVSSSGGSYNDLERWWTWGHFDTAAGFSNTATVVVRVTDTITPGETIWSNGGYQAFGDNAPTDPDESNNFFFMDTLIPSEEVFHYVYLPIIVRTVP